MSKIKEAQEKAWQLMKDKGFSLGEQITVRSAFASSYKDEYPFIQVDHITNKKMKDILDSEFTYRSEHKQISSLLFSSETEVIVANAIYEATKENFNPNDFTQQLKYTFRVIGLKSKWAE